MGYFEEKGDENRESTKRKDENSGKVTRPLQELDLSGREILAKMIASIGATKTSTEKHKMKTVKSAQALQELERLGRDLLEKQN